MNISKRQLLAGLGGVALCGAPTFGASQTRMDLGTRNIISVSDGHLVLPGSMFFEGLPPAPLDAILSEHGLSSDQLSPPCNLTLLKEADRTILFDAGAGPGFMSTAGSMLDSLAALGTAPEDITHVVFTHAHPDHLWGILDDFDDLVFPDAVMMIGQTEWDYWSDPNTVDSIGEARAAFAVGAARRFEAIAEKTLFIQDGDEILPGVMAHATSGHTPGHMSFEIRDGANAVMVGGDAIGNQHVAFAQPNWPSGADQDPDQAVATRSRLLDQLVSDDIALLGFHLPQGGLGRVARDGSAYRFIAEET